MKKTMISLGVVHIERESDKAVRLSFGNEYFDYGSLSKKTAMYWFPKALIELRDGLYGQTELRCPYWLAVEKRLL